MPVPMIRLGEFLPLLLPFVPECPQPPAELQLRLDRAIWRRWSGYPRRSRAETKMHCLNLLGHRLSARDFDCQVAEFQVRVAVLNGFTALGPPITEVTG